MNESKNGTSKVSVLMVEDTPSQAMRFKHCLESNGCYVHWAADGLGGLTAAREGNFDLIILDIQLPDIDGYEVCRRLKSDETMAAIPVIMLTTRDTAAEALTGLEQGAIDYIPKDPFAEMVLVQTIEHIK